ncbi:hypothetical protein MUP59_03015, partial [Candidatus Bathyarchaeota archaeon]|nr:hypothetical protein [Candidatus Bathyarchaeota archaeon]
RRDGRIVEHTGNLVEANFIYAGILSNDSRILRQLRGATDLEPDNFEWAVSEMSLAKWYQNISAITVTKREDLERNLRAYEATVKRDSDLQQNIKKMKTQIEETESRMASLIMVLGKDDVNQEKQMKLYEVWKELTKKIEDLRMKKASEESEIEIRQKEEKKNQSNVNKLKEEKQRLLDEKNKIDFKGQEKKIAEEKSVLDAESEKLKEKKSGIEGELNLLVFAEGEISTRSNDTTCPLCEDGRISLPSLKKRISNLTTEKAGLMKNLLGIQEKKRKLDSDLEESKLRFEEIKEQISVVDDGIFNTEVLVKNADTSGPEAKLKEFSMEEEKKEAKLKELQALLSTGDIENRKKRDKLQKERDVFGNEVIAGEIELSRSKVAIYGKTFSPKEAVNVTKEQIVLLNKTTAEMSRRAEAQKEEAKKLFNSSVKDLLDRLRFQEFKEVMLNKDYKLYVQRYDEKKRDYVMQNASSLSTSEKVAIALILQVALKETYVPNVPFLLVDDVLEDLDEGRLNTVLKYLSSKAKESDWYVVATKLVKGQVEPRIVTFKG